MVRILNIQRMSTEDGPGLRTSVFFKGCPLKCLWCQNPESIAHQLQIEWIKQSCIHCLECLKHCPKKAIAFEDDDLIIDPALCDHCLDCIGVCPSGALRVQGKDFEVEALHRELLKDKAYFTDGGGITFTGGEALLQHQELLNLARRLKQDNIHLALDTSGYAARNVFEKFIDVIDLFLYDIKLIDKEDHKQYCGVDNDLILSNLVELSNRRAKIWIRTPIIPGATDSESNIEGISNFLKENKIEFERWELCAFNDLCKDKYSRLKLDWQYKDEPKLTKKILSTLVDIAKRIIPDKVILGTGATRLEDAK